MVSSECIIHNVKYIVSDKLAFYLYSLQRVSRTYYYGEEDNLFRSQGPDGGFDKGYDQAGTFAGTIENVARVESLTVLR